MAHISNLINRFDRSTSTKKGKSTENLPISEKIVEDLRENLEHDFQFCLTGWSDCTQSKCNVDIFITILRPSWNKYY
jgi:hypothetical protein